VRICILEAVEAWERERAGAHGDHLDHSLERHARTAEAAAAALAAGGHGIVRVPVDGSLAARLADAQPDIVFTTYFGPGCREDQACVAAIVEFARIPMTAGGAACQFLGLAKAFSKRLFQSHGIPTAPFVDTLGRAPGEIPARCAALGYPLLVKARGGGEGLGVGEWSVVQDADQLADALHRVGEISAQAPLVERFLPGREFTVAILDGKPPTVLPILELLLGGARVYSWDAKIAGVEEQCPARIDDTLARTLGELAIRAGLAVGCRDYWRVDFRLASDGLPLVLEVNTLPGLMPGYSDFPKCALAAGVGHDRLVAAILDSALRRAIPPQVHGGPAPAG
jgi:D-alanine-D-alanine ligase